MSDFKPLTATDARALSADHHGGTLDAAADWAHSEIRRAAEAGHYACALNAVERYGHDVSEWLGLFLIGEGFTVSESADEPDVYAVGWCGWHLEAAAPLVGMFLLKRDAVEG